MKAKNIQITPDKISFSIFNDDGTPFLNASGRPVTHESNGWMNDEITNFTADDVEEEIDNLMYTTVNLVNRAKQRVSQRNQKIDRLSEIKSNVTAELTMIETPTITITSEEGEQTSPYTLAGNFAHVDGVDYILKTKDETIETGSMIKTPFSKDFSLDSDISYSIILSASNKRGECTETINITITAAPVTF